MRDTNLLKQHLGFRILLLLDVLLGIGVTGWLFTQKSEESHAVIGKFTYFDIGLIVVTGIIIIGLVLFFMLLFSKRLLVKIEFINLDKRCWWIRPVIMSLTLLAVEIFISSVVLQTEIFGLKQFAVVMGWIVIVSVGFLWFVTRDIQPRSSPERGEYWKASVLTWLPALALSIASYVLTIYFSRFSRFGYIFFCLVSINIIWFAKSVLSDQIKKWRYKQSIQTLAECLSVFFITFIVYRSTSILVGNVYTPAKSYFDELANAWINGQLFLSNPSQTHDLTFYNGEWYVANPPLVAVLMVPWVWIIGINSFNTVVWSCLNAAINGALLYYSLLLLNEKGWIKTSLISRISLTVFVLFGTAHFYLAIVGKMWFMSQMLTVTLVTLSVIVSIKYDRLWLSGVILALAIAARPNIVMIAPLLISVWWQKIVDKGEKPSSRTLMIWALNIAIPAGIVVLFLLGYNYLRFGNMLDYGYLTENVADFMAEDLRMYGTFHPHFFLRNFRVLLFNLPYFSQTCSHLVPSVEGLSVFLASPGLVLLFTLIGKNYCKTKYKVLIIGTSLSIITTLIPLLFYYNTGSWQFGYKYILDFVAPILFLMALSTQQISKYLLIGLVGLSVLINTYGVLWWFGLVCR